MSSDVQGIKSPRGRQPNHVSISSSVPAGDFANKVKRVFRQHETCHLGGLGQSVSTLVDVVNILTAHDAAELVSVKSSFMRSHRGSSSKDMKARMDVELKRGKRHLMFSGYKANRVADIFGYLDSDRTDVVSVAQLRKLMSSGVGFQGGAEAEAEDFLNDVDKQNQGRIQLRDFVYYFSLLARDSDKENFDSTITALLQVPI